jgi:hypothetical protein
MIRRGRDRRQDVQIAWQAAQAGREGAWSADDMARARSKANAYAPRGQASHGERWEAREPIPETLRAEFHARVSSEEVRVTEERGYAPASEQWPACRQLVERTAPFGLPGSGVRPIYTDQASRQVLERGN